LYLGEENKVKGKKKWGVGKEKIAVDTPRVGRVGKMSTEEWGKGKQKERGAFNPSFNIFLPNINSETGQALDH
jgi:hypothetical protein